MNQFFIFVLILFFLSNFRFRREYFFIRLGIGSDLLCFIIILLSLLICALIIIASNNIYFLNNFKVLFLFNLLILLMFLFLTFSIYN